MARGMFPFIFIAVVRGLMCQIVPCDGHSISTDAPVLLLLYATNYHSQTLTPGLRVLRLMMTAGRMATIPAPRAIPIQTRK